MSAMCKNNNYMLMAKTNVCTANWFGLVCLWLNIPANNVSVICRYRATSYWDYRPVLYRGANTRYGPVS